MFYTLAAILLTTKESDPSSAIERDSSAGSGEAARRKPRTAKRDELAATPEARRTNEDSTAELVSICSISGTNEHAPCAPHSETG